MRKLALTVGLILMMDVSLGGTQLVSIDKSLWGSVKSLFSKKSKLRYTSPEVEVLEIDENDIPELSSQLHEKRHRCGGFMQHSSLEDFKNLFSQKVKPIAFDKLLLSQENLVDRMLPDLNEANLQNDILQLSTQFKTRYYKSQEGVEAVQFQYEMWKAITAHRQDVRVELFKHKGFAQPSIILTIDGSEKSDEVVILGGHIDSINQNGQNSPAPGADDNASGIAAMTEVLRVLMHHDHKPKRTLKIMAYAAEEVGLLGSMEIARKYKKEKVKVMGMLQLDMTLFHGTKDKDIVLMKDYSNAKLNTFMGKLIDRYLKVRWGYDECGYACSDHASWNTQGYPASFAYEANFKQHNTNIHTSKDTLDKEGNSTENTLVFTKLALAFMIELGL